MSGNKVVLDTNVIIFASKQKIDIERLLSIYDEVYISIISFMEVYGYNFSEESEKGLIDEMFNNLDIVEVHAAIAEQVIEYRKNTLRKIKLPDAIILATAKSLGADLITDDWDDFQGIDKTVQVKKIDEFKRS
ncbi:MAG: type II toxin-antitoxin system VapC family toxin [Bacteroidota bacterium]